ncbi:tyrosine-protein phosphatase [Halalkalibacter krulwichiae]|uniref:Tyrosine-protein phosphatase n=1 Tax=Halalkalibacter krulwichiae TaxID=199441 RepID=A0A1X9MIA0_9BACI|nr:CpsB/CapC family capsule biosynthesis tyrosine phosphatase [Halalkalibacter krulwichiae]ARK32464.1 Tyrosine-protein phosphatase YwqE [Halalkalibacter krulwichiae]
MIDIHCHILPGVDDGPRNLAESLELARAAEAEGITTIIATPHHKHPSFENDGPSVLQKVDELNQALKEAEIAINVLPSQEVRIHGDLLENLNSKDVLPMTKDHKYILVELPTNSIPHYTSRLLYDIQMTGCTPIIAHPERNKVFSEDPNKLFELVNTGVLTQITATSLAGHLGKKIKTLSEQLIEANLAHFIASDAHNITSRPFHMREAYRVLEEQFGLQMVYMFQENAELVVSGQHINLMPPERVKKRKKFFNLF